MAKKKSKKMNINPKYLSGSKNAGRRAQLIRQIAEIYKKGKPYPSNLDALMKERDKLQAGGNPYAMPTSAATSGYTSTMSGMAGAHQAQMQLAQLQQEVMQTQQRRDEAAKQREAQEQQQFQQGMQQGAADLGQDLGQEAIKKAANAARMAKIAKGTASARQVAKASKDTGELLTNLGNYGKGASDAASAASAAGSSIGAGPIAAAASLAGKGIEKVSDDDDDTRTNFGEGAGRLLSGAGSGVGLAAMIGLTNPIGLIGAGLVGGTAALLRQRKQKLEAREEEARQQAQDRVIANAEQAAFNRSMFSTGQDMGFNVGSSMSNSYLPGYQMQGGGLWANIRAKRARGEKMRSKGEKGAPTEEQMQRAKAQAGGYMRPLPGGAVEFVGPKHSQGGIMLDENTEVEGGETMDKVKMKNNGGKAGDYIFSDYLKLGGKTFAARHKELLAAGGSQKKIQELAKMQERVANNAGRDENGPRDPNNIMQVGGEVEEGVIPNPEMIDEYSLAPDLAYARDFPEGQSRTDEGLYRRADGDQVTMDEVEDLKANNPWYDGWEDFDPTDPEDVKAFQKAYNEKVPEESRIKVDGKVGEQTVSAYIPYRRSEEMPTDDPEPIPTDTPEQEIITQDTEEQGDTPDDTPVMDLPRERRDVVLPYQLIGPMAELTSKYPQPNTIAAPVTGRIKLPRVNFNAERAALAGSTNAANKFIQNNAAGPGAIAAQMATIDKQRQGNIDIATQEARQNKQLAAQEELSNLQASQFDADQVARARQFNAASQNQRDQNEYEKRMLAFNQLGTNLAQFSNDMRAYKSEDRAARAYQIDNEYDRQVSFENAKRQARRKNSPYYGMTDMQIREEIARAYEQGAPTWNMQNQRRANAVIQATGTTPETNEETTTQKRGGYVRRLGGVRRRRR
mgnify:FL=1|jgi:hypothetical protein|tara:strand:+ start:50 stop:2767 length:2718 start_codon:yes stop_codon:yes gene_type:complete